MASTVAKPKLRRLLLDRLKFHIPLAIGLAAVTSVCLKMFWSDPRREKIAEFYRTYDVEAEATRLRNMGFYQKKE